LPPNHSMASKVKRKKLPAEAEVSLPNRDSGNKGCRAAGRAAMGSRHGVSHQAAPNNSWGSKSPGRLPWRGGVEDTQVQPACVQVDAGVESMLTVGEAHHGHGLPGLGAGLIPLLCWDAR
jgi:hypothetical protein